MTDELAQYIDKVDISEREREMVKYRLGLTAEPRKHTLEETGKVFGVTRERIRQVMEKVRVKVEEFKKLREIK